MLMGRGWSTSPIWEFGHICFIHKVVVFLDILDTFEDEMELVIEEGKKKNITFHSITINELINVP